MSGYDEIQAERLDAYRAVAIYARAYMEAVKAEDSAWEFGMARELETALLRVRNVESRIRVEAGVA